MSFTGETLIAHAFELLEAQNFAQLPEDVREASERRAVSAAYYGLFHQINGTAVRLIAPNVNSATNSRIQRWFNHTEMKTVCGHFLKTRLEKPLLGLIGETASPSMRYLAESFIRLQEARHSADYDLNYKLTSAEARQYVLLARGAMEALDRIADTAEANIFILSLLMWKNWEKER